MNAIHRIVWNASSSCWQAVPETASGSSKSTTRRTRTGRTGHVTAERLSVLAIAVAAAWLAATANPAWAGPQGGTVTAGSATIQTNGAQTTINQSTAKAAIDWTSFSVGKNEAVRFNQPSASAITLNRVTGTESSQIMGNLSANGQVFILNPNGVLVGNGAQVNVGGFVASTLRMSNQDFMSGNFKLSNPGSGSVVNQGQITVPLGGTIALIAPVVQNTGKLTAPQGTALLAAADAVTLKLQDGGLTSYTIDQGSLQALVDNGGAILTEGGHVVLTAKARDALAKASINHSGLIEAQTVGVKNGVVELLGDMAVGQVKLSGQIDASAPKGGDGGFVDTSAAKVKIEDSAKVSTLATQGKTGTWLIDPTDYIVAASGGDWTGRAVGIALDSNNLVLDSTAGKTTGNGDVIINDAISWSANTVLTLKAARNININSNITAAGNTAGLVLSYGKNGDFTLGKGAMVTMTGSTPSLKVGVSGAELDYSVINRADQMVNWASPANNAFGSKQDLALLADVDLIDLTYIPKDLYGNFLGFGHSIKNITIKSDWVEKNTELYNTQADIDSGTGIFSSTGKIISFVGNQEYATPTNIRDFKIINPNISGTTKVGAVAGYSQSNIKNVQVVGGSVTGTDDYVGGITGDQNFGVIENVSSGASINGVLGVGGIVGRTNSTVAYAQNTGTVSGDIAVGGVAGLLEGSSFAGINNSFAGGSVAGQYAVGGLVGLVKASAPQYYYNIQDSYAYATVNGQQDVGGLVGINAGKIDRTYAVGQVTGTTRAGGLTGTNTGTVTNSFWNAETTGQNSSSAGIQKSYAELGQRSTYKDWYYFAYNWRMDNSLPRLFSYDAPILAITTETLNKTYDGRPWQGEGVVYKYTGGAASDLAGLPYVVSPTTAPGNSFLSDPDYMWGKINVRNESVPDPVTGYPDYYFSVTGAYSNTHRITYGSPNNKSPSLESYAFINPADLKVIANSGEHYQDGSPFKGGFGVKYDGFKGLDDATVISGNLTYSGNSQGATEMGRYYITPSGLSAKNYNVSFINGELYIKPEKNVQITDVVPDGAIIGFIDGSSISSIQDTVNIIHKDKSVSRVDFFSGSVAIRQGDVIVTKGNEGGASIRFIGDGSTLRLDPDSVVEIIVPSTRSGSIAEAILFNGDLWGRVMTSTGVRIGGGGLIAGVRG
jgi:filamentous hemagglutinin family protein